MKGSFFLIATLFLCTHCIAQKKGKALPATDTIVVVSYNIHHGNPPDKPGIIELDSIAKVISDLKADIVALQEVDIHTKRSGNKDEATEIANKLGMQAVFGKAIDYDGGTYGVAILSKYKITGARTTPLPMDTTTKGEPRVLLTARISLPSGRYITFGCTHLDAQKANTNRLLQIAEINRITGNAATDLVLAGDFNDLPGSPVINELVRTFNRSCSDCPPTIPVHKPARTIDFINTKKGSSLKTINHFVPAGIFASDHLPVQATFIYPSTAKP